MQVIFFVLVFLCFVRSFSKLRWCWWGRVEAPRHDVPRFGRAGRGGLDWDRVIASLLVALADSSAVIILLVSSIHINRNAAHVCVMACRRPCAALCRIWPLCMTFLFV